MIHGEPNPISGGQNEMFAQPLVGCRKSGRSFTEGENKREIKGQIRVSLVLFTVKKKKTKREQKRQASPATNDSQGSSMTKQRCFGEQSMISNSVTL